MSVVEEKSRAWGRTSLLGHEQTYRTGDRAAGYPVGVIDVEDVRQGYVTREVAARDYGVVLDGALEIDEAETMRLRNERNGEGIR